MPLSRTRIKAIFAATGIHLLVAGVLTAFFVGSHPSWDALRTTFLFNLIFTLSIGFVATTIFGRVLPRFKLTGWRQAIGLGIAFMAAVAIGVELALAVITTLWGEVQAPGRIEIWRIASVVTLVMTVIGVTYDRLRAHARAVELRAQEAQRALLDAQLQNLRDRLNPHFLFNSLNTLAGLIEEHPPRAVEALERLCDLLRYGLESSEETLTTLGRELSAIDDYLHMEELRFGDRLRWEVDVPDALHTARVPVLLLQPIVENAVKYAVSPRRAGGRITVRGELHDNSGQLVLSVLDDGAGDVHASGTKLGQRTLEERLSLTYGTAARVSAGPEPGGGYRVQVELPHAPADPAGGSR